MIQTNLNLGDDIQYSILINRIEYNTEKMSQEELFDSLKKIQKKYPKSIIQLFSTRYLINKNHLIYAIYFTLKAYHRKTLISHRPSIELLLYLSANRQIEEGIKNFGMTDQELKKGILNYCIAANEPKIATVNRDFLQHFDHKEKSLKLKIDSVDEFNRIKNLFKITDTQLKTKLHSLGVHRMNPNLKNQEDITLLSTALCDLIVEKMVLLSLEST